jgi:hypothetical protein
VLLVHPADGPLDLEWRIRALEARPQGYTETSEIALRLRREPPWPVQACLRARRQGNPVPLESQAHLEYIAYTIGSVMWANAIERILEADQQTDADEDQAA